MAKPTISESQWNTDGTNETAPSAAHKTDGWGAAPGAGGRLASSTVMNYWKRRVYQWLSYLDGFFDGSDNIVMPVNKSVSVSGTGKHKRGARVRHFAASSGRETGGNFPQIGVAPLFHHGNWNPTAADQVLTVELQVDEGETITNLSAEIITDATATITMTLVKAEMSLGLIGAGVANATSAAVAASLATLSTGAISAAVGAGGETWLASFRVNGAITGGGAAPFQVGTISLTTTIP